MGLPVLYLMCSQSRFTSNSTILGHQNLLQQMKILHRDISIGNVLITEDENEGFLIDLDRAVRVDRERPSGAPGTRPFMSIGLLLKRDKRSKLPPSFMDDLESMFWLLFWICVHYSGPRGSQVGSTEYEEWNFLSPGKLAGGKTGAVGKEQDFLDRIKAHFTDYYAPLIPWINRLRREVFPNGFRWTEEDLSLYDRMRAVLEQAMRDPKVKAGWPEETREIEQQTVERRYQTRRKGPIEGTSGPALEGH
jgi:serine/threonine protein kinase